MAEDRKKKKIEIEEDHLQDFITADGRVVALLNEHTIVEQLKGDAMPIEGAPINLNVHSVGDALKLVRTERSTSLTQAAQALNIREYHLHAIEENRFDALPSLTYSLGFVRSYAKYLDLNPDEMVKRFKIEMLQARPETESTTTLGALSISIGKSRPPYIWIAVGSVAVIAVLWLLYIMWSSLNTESGVSYEVSAPMEVMEPDSAELLPMPPVQKVTGIPQPPMVKA